jgi:hypothetical protein
MSGAPRRGRLARPAPEGPREGAQFRVAEGRRDLTERNPRIAEQPRCDLELHLVRDLPKGGSLSPEAAAQGAAVDAAQARDILNGALAPQQLGPKETAQGFRKFFVFRLDEVVRIENYPCGVA